MHNGFSFFIFFFKNPLETLNSEELSLSLFLSALKCPSKHNWNNKENEKASGGLVNI